MAIWITMCKHVIIKLYGEKSTTSVLFFYGDRCKKYTDCEYKWLLSSDRLRRIQSFKYDDFSEVPGDKDQTCFSAVSPVELLYNNWDRNPFEFVFLLFHSIEYIRYGGIHSERWGISRLHHLMIFFCCIWGIRKEPTRNGVLFVYPVRLVHPGRLAHNRRTPYAETNFHSSRWQTCPTVRHKPRLTGLEDVLHWYLIFSKLHKYSNTNIVEAIII